MPSLEPVLTESQVADYHRDGFVVVSGLIDGDLVATMADEVDLFQRGDKQVGITPFSESLATDETFGRMSMMSWLAESSAPLRAALHHPRCLAVAAELLGPDVSWWWDQAAVKNPVADSTFPWHQDDGYEVTEPPLTLNIVIAIDATTVENGCIWAIPGSHQRGLLDHWIEPGAWHRTCYKGPEQGVPVETKAGDALVLHCRTLHRSPDNQSASKRRAYLAAYCNSDVRSAETGLPYDDKPQLVRGGQPTEIVLETWAIHAL